MSCLPGLPEQTEQKVLRRRERRRVIFPFAPQSFETVSDRGRHRLFRILRHIESAASLRPIDGERSEEQMSSCPDALVCDGYILLDVVRIRQEVKGRAIVPEVEPHIGFVLGDIAHDPPHEIRSLAQSRLRILDSLC